MLSHGARALSCEAYTMIEFVEGHHPVVQALIATTFTWFLTALGASIVFFARGVNQRFLDGANGFAAGVMIAASIWSLLIPAIEMSEGQTNPAWLPAALGFMAGGLALFGIDKALPHLHPDLSEAEGPHTNLKRVVLLVLAITLHNIPEGLAVGVAFGGAAAGLEAATLAGAVALAIGIGLQNFPEGIAVAMPLRRESISRLKAFWYGQLSAVVEPVAGVAGAAAALAMRDLLPYGLSFAAGAMIFVVVEELVPSASRSGHTDVSTIGTLIGFTVMMVLDVALG
jgi:ZIP family zinc transporter